MENVDAFGDAKKRLNIDYLMALEDQLKDCVEDAKTNNVVYKNQNIRVLEMKIRILRKRLLKGF